MNLYPKSQVFRKNYARDSPSGSPKNHHMIGTQAGKQGLQLNLWNQESTGLDTLLKGLMDPNTRPKPNTPNNQILPIYVPKDLKPISKFLTPKSNKSIDYLRTPLFMKYI